MSIIHYLCWEFYNTYSNILSLDNVQKSFLNVMLFKQLNEQQQKSPVIC